MLFQTFARTGAAHATVKFFSGQRLLFPMRLDTRARKGELVWTPLNVNRAVGLLHNPWYAGAYVYGRFRWKKQPGGRMKREGLPRSEWLALIKDAHPAYISWEEHLQIQERLEISAKALGFERGEGPPREGPALLQGRVVCGLCGRPMQVQYHTRRSRTRAATTVTSYVCGGRGRPYAQPMCQSILGMEIDASLGKPLVETVQPTALELALAVHDEIQARLEEADRLRCRQVERAQYEADAARHRYMQVDPANRLVADSLEADWNERLRALAEARKECDRQRARDRAVLDDDQRSRILALSTDFPAVWSDPRTPHREKKRMLALLVEDVTLTKEREITAHVRFRGGATTTLTLPRPKTYNELRITSAEAREQMNAMLDEYTDAQVAQALNARGLRTGAGEPFDSVSVQWARFSARLSSLKDRLLAAGWLTRDQAIARYGVSRTMLGRWRIQGRIKARICNNRGEWLYWPSADAAPDRESPDSNAQGPALGRSTARGAM